jgi:hypothetical protein
MKIPFRSWFSTPKERHSFVIGFSEAICFFHKPYIPLFTADYKANPIYTEEHYYAGGRASGVLFYVAIGLIVFFTIFIG